MITRRQFAAAAAAAGALAVTGRAGAQSRTLTYVGWSQDEAASKAAGNPWSSAFRFGSQWSTKAFKANPVPIVIPIGAEENFTGVIDLIKMKAIIWDEASQGMKFDYHEIPAELVATAVGEYDWSTPSARRWVSALLP